MGWEASCAERGAGIVFPSHRGTRCPLPCRRTPGSLTVSQKRQQRGQEQQGCREHPVGCSRAPGRGPERGRGLGGAWAPEAELGPVEERERGRRRRQRLTKSAPRPAPGVGAGDRRAGLGAGARERLTVKSQAKAQKTQRREHRLPRCRLLRESTALLMWAHGPHPSALPTPCKAQSLFSSLAACQRGGILT